MRSCSLVVGPNRWPASRSAWRTHRRNVSCVQPILAATEPIADHCDVWLSCCSSTSRTARSRTSFGKFADLLIAPSSQEMESPGKPGRFKGASLPVPMCRVVEEGHAKQARRWYPLPREQMRLKSPRCCRCGVNPEAAASFVEVAIFGCS